MALIVPAGASAKRPEDKPAKGNKTEKTKLATANVKGTVVTNDGSTMTVAVSKASGHMKACKDMTLTFDVSAARIHTADNDLDADMDAADVLVGHDVKVRAKVALSKGRKTTCSVAATDVLAAQAVHNRTTPALEDDSDEETVEDELGDSLVGAEELEDEEEADDEPKVKSEDKGKGHKKSKGKKSKDD